MNNKESVNSSWLRDIFTGLAFMLLVITIASLQALHTSASSIKILLIFGLAGAMLHALTSLSSSLRLPSPVGLIQSALITAILAACADTKEVWSMPVNWLDMTRLSLFGSSLFITIYHIANQYIMTSQKRSIGIIGACLILLTPYATGLLLVLQSEPLLGVFGKPFIGRAVALILFNEFVVNAFALLRSQRPAKGIAIHLWLAVPAIAVVSAPYIADLGSSIAVATYPSLIRSAIAVVCTSISQSALWAEAFLLTGLILDGMRGVSPDCNVVRSNSSNGAIKGAMFSGILMGLIQLMGLTFSWSLIHSFFGKMPFVLLAVGGSLTFPLFRTVIESFDGSQQFFMRAGRAYHKPDLYIRGIVIGLALAVAIDINLPGLSTGTRMMFGAVAGIVAFAGISILRDVTLHLMGRGRMKSYRPYFVEGCLGMFIGGILAFYLDVNQLPIIFTKFDIYTSFGMDSNAIVSACNAVRTTRPDEFRALLNNWGYIRLSPATGGAKVLFNEALIGVSVWGIAASLFAINHAFLRALFQKTWAPVREIPSRQGIHSLAEGTVRVMRWGLWMSPIIFTFLRPMGSPTWYNQDGAIRSICATFNNIFMSPEAFNEWSLTVFIWLLVYSGFRILIFIDHMGLRVATLVNLSFIGMDRLDEKISRFVRLEGGAGFIPESVKRFTTWAPLLIPFYLPAGSEWSLVWDESRARIAAADGGVLSGFMALGLPLQIMICAGMIIIATLIARLIRIRSERAVAVADVPVEAKTMQIFTGRDFVVNADILPKGQGQYPVIDQAGENIGDNKELIRINSMIDGDWPESFVDQGNGSYFRLSNNGVGYGTSVVGSPSFRTNSATHSIPKVNSLKFDGDAGWFSLITEGVFREKDMVVASVSSKRTWHRPPEGRGPVHLDLSTTLSIKEELTLCTATGLKDRFRWCMLSSMYVNDITYDSNLLRFEDADGQTQEISISEIFDVNGGRRRDGHLFPEPVPLGGWMELVKTTGSSWLPTTPSIRYGITNAHGMKLGVQGWWSGSDNPDDDNLNIWLEWIDPPDRLESGKQMKLDIEVVSMPCLDKTIPLSEPGWPKKLWWKPKDYSHRMDYHYV